LLLLNHVCLGPRNASKLFSIDTIQNLLSSSTHGAVAQKAFRVAEPLCPLDAFFHPPHGHIPLPLILHSRRRALTMIRHPLRRLQSAFTHERHHVGMDPDDAWKVMSTTTVEGYARFPGIAACQTKMILGHGCASNVLVTKDDALTAMHVLEHAFVFVGVTDRWNQSVALFHAMYGGAVQPFELSNLRPSRPHFSE
jgi:V8-like Glu-specific endopeptidase